MTNKELIKQYVTTGQPIGKYQLDKLANYSKNLLKSHLRSRGIAFEHVPLESYEFPYIDYIPEEYLRNLQKLFLQNNELTTLPDSVGNLVNLQKLFLSHNQLTSLPDSIGQLGNLQKLYLSYNQLQSLPDSIGNLGNLQRLDLHDNQLTTLPDSLGNLGNLKWLNLRGNPISENELLKIKKMLPNTDIYL